MDIDYLKWKVEKAEGFDLVNEGDDIFPDWVLYHNGYGVDPKSGDFEETTQCQLLLQRAIEGVNMDNNYVITQNEVQLEVGNYTTKDNYAEYKYMSFDNYDSIDPAKESALRYIYEQEKAK